MDKRPKVMITFREGGENGGPYTSHKRITESSLKEQYRFIPLIIPKGRIGLFNIKLINKLKKDISKEKPDIVHLTGLQLEGFHVIIACLLAKVENTVLAIHGSSLEAEAFPKWKKSILNMIEIATIKLSKVCYGVSEYVAQWDRVIKYSKKSYGRIYNIPSSNDLDINMDKKKESIRLKLGISEQDIVVVSTGRITREKGYPVLLEAIKNIKTDVNVKYLIVGNGEFYQEMRKEILKANLEDNILMLGFRNDIEEILSESDIFVICSLHETLCISLLEAARHSLPLVATRVGGIPEIVEDNYNGYLVPKNNSSSVTASLEKLIMDENLRKLMGSRAKQTIDRKFNTKEIINQLDSIYRSLLK